MKVAKFEAQDFKASLCVIEKRRIKRVVENGSTKEYVLSEPFEVIRLEEVRDAEYKS